VAGVTTPTTDALSVASCGGTFSTTLTNIQSSGGGRVTLTQS
jgi:hypothetical protein